MLGFILITRFSLLFYFTLSLHFIAGLQSAVCILPSVCSLRFTLTECEMAAALQLYNNHHTKTINICSCFSGELLLWDLSKDGKEQYKAFGVGHSRIVFTITCDVAGTRIMTVSMDRQVKFLSRLTILVNKGRNCRFDGCPCCSCTPSRQFGILFLVHAPSHLLYN